MKFYFCEKGDGGKRVAPSFLKTILFKFASLHIKKNYYKHYDCEINDERDSSDYLKAGTTMDERNAIQNRMKSQNFLVQTVETVIIKIKIKVGQFIITYLFYFHEFLYRLSYGSHFVVFKFQPYSKRRS